MGFIDINGNFYRGDRQYSIVDNDLVWDIVTTSDKPDGNFTPIITNGVHVGWQEVPKTIEDQIDDIEEKYQVKFNGLAQRLNAVILSDGTTQESKTVATQNEYLQLSDEKDLEILALFEGGE